MHLLKKIGSMMVMLILQPIPVAAQTTNTLTYFENTWQQNLSCEHLALRTSPYYVLNQTLSASQSSLQEGTVIDYTRKNILRDSSSQPQRPFNVELPLQYLDTAEKWNLKIYSTKVGSQSPDLNNQTLEISRRSDGSYLAQRCCNHLRCQILPIFKVKNSTAYPFLSFAFQNSNFIEQMRMQKIGTGTSLQNPLPLSVASQTTKVASPSTSSSQPSSPTSTATSTPWVQNVVCTREGPLRIYDDTLENVIYRIRRFQEIKVYQGWNGGREERYSGQTLLIKVQAHNAQGTAITGWAAASLIKRPEDCPAMGLVGSPSGETLIEGSTIVVDNTVGHRFPTERPPLYDYVRGSGLRYFGAPRDGRLHAACDLFRNPGDKVFAISGGKILSRYHFYAGTDAIEVQHDSGKIVRYGEVSSFVPGLSRVNDRVVKGQHIGNVSNLRMLHFEMFRGTGTGPLTQGRGQYSRRSDLMDPTQNLKQWQASTF